MAGRKQSSDIPDTARKIMLCAERLFGQHGLDGVSLRQIIEAAGQSNNSTILYYFGSKQGLIQAVHDMRAPAIEAVQRDYLRRIGGKGAGSLQQYVEALQAPVLEVVSKADRVNYAKFLLRLLPLGDVQHPYYRSAMPSSAMAEIIGEIQAKCPHVPPEVTAVRIRMAANIFHTAIIDFPRLARMPKKPFATEALYWQEVFQILLAMVECPYPSGFVAKQSKQLARVG